MEGKSTITAAMMKRNPRIMPATVGICLIRCDLKGAEGRRPALPLTITKLLDYGVALPLRILA
jgi:hypothetical protein